MAIDPLSHVCGTREELVRMKAYEIYERHGRQPGRDIDHWLAAEQEVSAVQDLDVAVKANSA